MSTKPKRPLKKDIKPRTKKLSIREKIARAQGIRLNWLQRVEEAKSKVAMLEGEINGRISDILEDEPDVTPEMILQQVEQIMNPQPQMPQQVAKKK